MKYIDALFWLSVQHAPLVVQLAAALYHALPASRVTTYLTSIALVCFVRPIFMLLFICSMNIVGCMNFLPEKNITDWQNSACAIFIIFSCVSMTYRFVIGLHILFSTYYWTILFCVFYSLICYWIHYFASRVGYMAK